MSAPGRIRTPLTELTGVEHPIVQTGMGWVAGPRLVAATARAGGLGILASATMNLDHLEKAILEVQERTDRPFGVNLRADAGDAASRIDLLIRHGVRVASFALAPKPELIARLKASLGEDGPLPDIPPGYHCHALGGQRMWCHGGTDGTP